MDEPAARAYIAREKSVGRRDGAVAHVRDEYVRTRHPGLWAALSDVCTGLELDGLPPPETPKMELGRHALLPRRQYAQLIRYAWNAPVGSAGAIFMMALSGPVTVATSFLLHYDIWAGWGLIAIMYGTLCAYLDGLVLGAARGRARPPGLREPLEDGVLRFMLHFVRWLSATAVAFMPFTLFLAAYIADGNKAFIPFAVLTALAGLAWYPVALLQTTFGFWGSAFNVPYGLACIRRLGGDYWRCVTLFIVTAGAATLFHVTMRALTGGASTTGHVAAHALVGAVSYASSMVQMRAIGLLCYARDEVR